VFRRRRHPFAEDIKLKNFYALVPFTVDDVCAPGFLDRYIEACRTAAPLLRFLTDALGSVSSVPTV
jgi:hypothetical protein